MTNNPARILVVDDEKLIRWSVGERLQREGLRGALRRVGRGGARASWRPPGPTSCCSTCGCPASTASTTLAARARAPAPTRGGHDVRALHHRHRGGGHEARRHRLPGQAVPASRPWTRPVERALAAARTRRRVARRSPRSAGGERGRRRIVGHLARGGAAARHGLAAGRQRRHHGAHRGRERRGKEVVARAIHFAERPRRAAASSQVNCAALPEHLLESELFGHERGAFTGAHAQKRGLFESADGGTLFLDEIGELPPAARPSSCALLEKRDLPPGGRRAASSRRRARPRRHQRGPRGDGRRGALPRRPLLPAQRGPHPHAAAARAPRGHPDAGAHFLAPLQPATSKRAGAGRRPPTRWSCCRPTTGRATSASCAT